MKTILFVCLILFSGFGFSQTPPSIPSTNESLTPSSMYKNLDASSSSSSSKKTDSYHGLNLDIDNIYGGEIAIVDDIEDPNCIFFLQYSESAFTQQLADIQTVNVNCK